MSKLALYETCVNITRTIIFPHMLCSESIVTAEIDVSISNLKCILRDIDGVHDLFNYFIGLGTSKRTL